MDARMKRDMPATLPTVITVMGRMRWLPMSTSFSHREKDSKSSDVRPEIGSHWCSSPKCSMSSNASQKPGMAKPRKTRTVIPRSKNDPCFQAESTPTGMATSSVSKSEAMFIPMVRGSRSPIFSMTGRASLDMDMPKSSRMMRDSQSRYCS